MTIQAVYQKNRKWADGLMPLVIDLLAKECIQIAPEQLDLEMGTDIVITGGNYSIRLRSIEYLKFNDFTVRSSHASGGMTEFQKWQSEHAPDKFLYGYVDTKAPVLKISPAHLIDVKKWKAALDAGRIHSRNRKPQTDGTEFIYFPFLPEYDKVIA